MTRYVFLTACCLSWNQECLGTVTEIEGTACWMYPQFWCPDDLQQGPSCCLSDRCALPHRGWGWSRSVGKAFAIRTRFLRLLQRKRAAHLCVANTLLRPFPSDFWGGLAAWNRWCCASSTSMAPCWCFLLCFSNLLFQTFNVQNEEMALFAIGRTDFS